MVESRAIAHVWARGRTTAAHCAAYYCACGAVLHITGHVGALLLLIARPGPQFVHVAGRKAHYRARHGAHSSVPYGAPSAIQCGEDEPGRGWGVRTGVIA